MTPQLQQAIKLLQLSNQELTAYVEDELEQNPLLERDEAAETSREARKRISDWQSRPLLDTKRRRSRAAARGQDSPIDGADNDYAEHRPGEPADIGEPSGGLGASARAAATSPRTATTRKRDADLPCASTWSSSSGSRSPIRPSG